MNDLQAIAPVQPIREVVYEQLKTAVLSGTFAQGERLVEHDIATRLQVSRTPVREALKRLESEGFLEALPKQGLVVKEHSDDEIREIYLIREALESLAAGYAARNATKSDLRNLEMLVAEMDRVNANPGANAEDIFEAHRRFSEAYNRASHMPTLVHMIESLREQVARLRRVSLSGSKRKVEAQREHHELLDAIVARKSELAVELARNHVRKALEAYFESTSD